MRLLHELNLLGFGPRGLGNHSHEHCRSVPYGHGLDLMATDLMATDLMATDLMATDLTAMDLMATDIMTMDLIWADHIVMGDMNTKFMATGSNFTRHKSMVHVTTDPMTTGLIVTELTGLDFKEFIVSAALQDGYSETHRDVLQERIVQM
ncbi:hypothetical protein KGM_204788 [Danaus plexippus plexippus]|uniref:Uncharacterized protein n=1 Tax=Danaus plexippus plexippus TaxID=278856 RepID=A0A212FIS0_DANPL|nr:hypothetical protein KGM_204788 [Danaus plexippus plexippus]